MLRISGFYEIVSDPLSEILRVCHRRENTKRERKIFFVFGYNVECMHNDKGTGKSLRRRLKRTTTENRQPGRGDATI